jgi:hypothetical protein
MAIAESRKTKTPDKKHLLIVFISALLVASGFLGWIKFKQEQDKKIQQAQMFLTQLCQTSFAADTNVLDSSQKVNQAAKLLQSIPNLPGFAYQQIQSELTNFSSCIKTAQVIENFFTAKKLSEKALGVDENTIISLQSWQAIYSDLAKAIASLKNIPPDVNIYAKAQQELKQYQIKLGELNQLIEKEQIAITAFNSSEALNREVDKINQNQPNLDSLGKAESKIKNAIQVLETIPPGTTVSEKSKNLLSTYQHKLADIKYKIANLKLESFVKNSYNFATAVDTKMEYQEYSAQLNKLKSNFNDIIQQSSAIKNHDSAKALSKALNCYNDAQIIWRYCHEGNCSTSISAGFLELRRVLWLPSSFAIKGVPLTQKYQVPVNSNIFRKKYIRLNDTLINIWKQAEKHIKEAQVQI